MKCSFGVHGEHCYSTAWDSQLCGSRQYTGVNKLLTQNKTTKRGAMNAKQESSSNDNRHENGHYATNDKCMAGIFKQWQLSCIIYIA